MRNSKVFFALAIAGSLASGSSMASEDVVDYSEGINNSIAYSKKQDELKVKQLMLQITEVQDQIDEVKHKAQERNKDEDIANLNKSWEEKLEALKKDHEKEVEFYKRLAKISEEEINNIGKERVSKFNLENIFLTRVYQKDGVGYARVFVDNSVRNKKKGEEIAPGIKILSIDNDSMKVQKGSEIKIITITTTERARSKSFDQSKSNISNGFNMPFPASGDMSGSQYVSPPVGAEQNLDVFAR